MINNEEFFQHPADILSKVIHFIGLSPLSNKMIASIVFYFTDILTTGILVQTSFVPGILTKDRLIHTFEVVLTIQ